MLIIFHRLFLIRLTAMSKSDNFLLFIKLFVFTNRFLFGLLSVCNVTRHKVKAECLVFLPKLRLVTAKGKSPVFTFQRGFRAAGAARRPHPVFPLHPFLGYSLSSVSHCKSTLCRPRSAHNRHIRHTGKHKSTAKNFPILYSNMHSSTAKPLHSPNGHLHPGSINIDIINAIIICIRYHHLHTY